jgi:hypothetical protein
MMNDEWAHHFGKGCFLIMFSSVFRELCQTYREIFFTQTNTDCCTDKHRM